MLENQANPCFLSRPASPLSYLMSGVWNWEVTIHTSVSGLNGFLKIRPSPPRPPLLSFRGQKKVYKIVHLALLESNGNADRIESPNLIVSLETVFLNISKELISSREKWSPCCSAWSCLSKYLLRLDSVVLTRLKEGFVCINFVMRNPARIC